MALNQRKPRLNRYTKKSGKGGFALAAFLVFVCLLLVGGYLVSRYLQQVETPQAQVAISPQPLPQTVISSSLSPASSSVKKKIVEAVPPIRQDYYEGDLHPDASVPRRPKRIAGVVELAIVVDDMGSSLQEARSLAAIGVPVSFAIIPGLRHDQEVASYAAGQGIEILVHMPMQPKGYPQRRLESNGLLLQQSNQELRSRVLGYLETLPGAVGGNNHMGSDFTEHSEKMRVILNVLQERGLFFLDSITTPRTTGVKVAAELHMRYARRDVFLDNEKNEAYIRGQLAQAVTRAQRSGHAIAICHPHPVTIATLTKMLPELQAKGITLVPVTKLLVN